METAIFDTCIFDTCPVTTVPSSLIHLQVAGSSTTPPFINMFNTTAPLSLIHLQVEGGGQNVLQSTL
jgi:hypothetical protein